MSTIPDDFHRKLKHGAHLASNSQRDDPNNKIVTPRIDRHSRWKTVWLFSCEKTQLFSQICRHWRGPLHQVCDQGAGIRGLPGVVQPLLTPTKVWTKYSQYKCVSCVFSIIRPWPVFGRLGPVHRVVYPVVQIMTFDTGPQLIFVLSLSREDGRTSRRILWKSITRSKPPSAENNYISLPWLYLRLPRSTIPRGSSQRSPSK